MGSLYQLTEHCYFGSAKNDNIWNNEVIGLVDKLVSQQLLLDSSLTLTKAIEAELIKVKISCDP